MRIQKVGFWQKDVVSALIALLQPNEEVRALVVRGSLVNLQIDPWSDVDVLIVVAESYTNLHPRKPSGPACALSYKQ
jgi:hypothetical protein